MDLITSIARWAAPPATCAIAMLVGGCATLQSPTIEQKRNRTVYVLPGIEGRSRLNVAIANGLADGGVNGAIEINDWTTWSGPFGWFVHLTNHERNRIEAFRLARRIMKDQRTFPGSKLFLVAHSGGAGIALLAVEALSASLPVDGVILLGGAVSRDRPLAKALARTERGIWNFYSKRDIAMLIVGTSMFGTMDRSYGPSAGALGFNVPTDLSERETVLYESKLHQVEYRREMSRNGNRGTHLGWANREFVAHWIAPIIMNQPMPAMDDTEDLPGDPPDTDLPTATPSLTAMDSRPGDDAESK